jgi:hypothetical protein
VRAYRVCVDVVDRTSRARCAEAEGLSFQHLSAVWTHAPKRKQKSLRASPGVSVQKGGGEERGMHTRVGRRAREAVSRN